MLSVADTCPPNDAPFTLTAVNFVLRLCFQLHTWQILPHRHLYRLHTVIWLFVFQPHIFFLNLEK